MNLFMSKKILLDTNILIYGLDDQSPFYKSCKKILEDGFSSNEKLFYIPDKVLYELFRIFTSKAFSKKISPKEAQSAFDYFATSSAYEKIFPTENTLSLVSELLKLKPSKNKNIFDLVVTALALENSIETIYTKNTKDFPELPNLRIIDPT